MSGGWQILDVRLESERSQGHVSGSLHIQLTELAGRAGELERETPILIYCKSGSRAAMAAEALRGAGYEVAVVDGGIQAWIEAGLPIES